MFKGILAKNLEILTLSSFQSYIIVIILQYYNNRKFNASFITISSLRNLVTIWYDTYQFYLYNRENPIYYHVMNDVERVSW